MTDYNCFVPDSFGIKAQGSGDLSGKTFVVKDLFAIKGHTSSFGNSQWRKTHQKSKDYAPIIKILLNAGADLIGLTKMDQLAYSLVGNIGEGESPVNPRYPDRFTGGSSSGSASAVAAKLADFGLGTDTGGSIRIPAAACGLFSIRPTHTRIDCTGVIPLAQSFDVVGTFTRSGQLLSEIFELLKLQSSPSIRVKRFLLLTGCFDFISPEVANLIKQTAEYLSRKLKVPLVEITNNTLVNPSVGDLFARNQSLEIWGNHGRWVEANNQYLADDVKVRLDRAKSLTNRPDKEKQHDIDQWQQYQKHFNQLVQIGDIAIIPVMPGLIPRKDAGPDQLLDFRQKSFRLSAISSLTGCPQIVIPITDKNSGLTYGIGFLSTKNQDETLLSLAKLF